jgi:hypothetical protein
MMIGAAAPRHADAVGLGDGARALVLALVWCVALVAVAGRNAPPDLAALYFAGHFFGTDRPELIYITVDHLASVLKPSGWAPYAGEIGFTGTTVYPYVYPPLWAALMAPVTRLLSPDEFFFLAYVVQAALICTSVLLAWRLLALGGQLARWMLVLLLLVSTSSIGMLALYHCQPQIAVTFLILLAFEREASGRPLQAGTALALAAALKLYPAAFAIFWIAGRNWPAVRSFAVIGGALGLASLGLGGIDLHRAFLARTSAIGEVVIGSRYNYNLENLLYQLTHAPQMLADPLFGRSEKAVTFIRDYTAADPAWLRLAVIGVFIAGAVLIARRWPAGDALWRRRALFPAAMVLASLCLPLGWAHQYLILLFLLPGLCTLYGLRRGLAIIGAFGLLHLTWVLYALGRLDLPVQGSVAAATLSFAVLFLLFALAPRPAPAAAG